MLKSSTRGDVFKPEHRISQSAVPMITKQNAHHIENQGPADDTETI